MSDAWTDFLNTGKDQLQLKKEADRFAEEKKVSEELKRQAESKSQPHSGRW